MNITSHEIIEHLRTTGFNVGISRRPLADNGRVWQQYLGQKDEIGVSFKWIKCDGTDDDLCRALKVTGCPIGDHVHVSVSIRTGAGGRYGNFTDPFILRDLGTLDSYRGAPSERTQIDRKSLPKPYNFHKDRFLVSGRRYVRTGVIASAELVDVVGIQDNAKIDVDMAAKPDEPVWFHFDCQAGSGATFDIITDGDVWYPINRKSRRVTTQMKPKKSVDLTHMSVVDQEFLLAAIQDFASKV
jgi:hypothetical protein